VAEAPQPEGLTVVGAELDGRHVGLRCADDRIAAVGPQVEPESGDELIDASGLILVPPLINAHTHAAMTLFRGYGDDLPLMEWLENWIWPAEAKLEPADVYWGTRLAAVEMIRSGTTRFFDMYWHGTEVARAVTDAGIRAVVSSVMIDRLDSEAGKKERPEALELLDSLAALGPLVTPGFAPHGIYTVSGESLVWIAEVAAERDLPVQIHLAETEDEVKECASRTGKTPARYLDELGFLGPRTALAHCVWLEPEEFALLAERGATVVTNPAANMKLAVGRAFPYPEAAAAGVAMGLGTDGVSSNSNLDMFEEVKLLALLQKHASGDSSVLPAAEALAIARGLRSPLIGGTPLEPGAPADFLLLRAADPELSAGGLQGDLVYAASGSIVDTTVVAGRVLMRGRVVPDAEEIAAEVRARAARLTAD
jgi:5-methylthioadenosine/S-adenosylhomocysteine deaminase